MSDRRYDAAGRPFPTEIRLRKDDKILDISFENGQKFSLPCELLRVESPSAEVQVLAGQPGVTVTGTVPDVRPYVAHAALSVAPLRVARGIQNKVLEAMAMAKAVLVTPQALEGIEAGIGRELLLADGAQQWLAAATEALAGPPEVLEAVGQAARARVLASYSWDARLAPLDRMIETPAAQDAGAAPALWTPA